MNRPSSFLWVGSLFVGFLFLGAGCQMPRSLSVPLPSTEEEVNAPAHWEAVSRGVERQSIRFATTTGAEIILYRFEPKTFRLHLDSATSVKRISEWQTHLTGEVFVINGVYFHEDDLPSGFFVQQGRRVGTRQFDLDKTGLMDFSNGGLRLMQPSASIKLASLKEAAQSYPFLIQDGKMAVKTDSGKAARRSFLGLDRQGRIYFGILPYAQLSLHELAKQLAAVPVEWERVLNLDGGPSSGIAFSSAGFSEIIDSYVAVPNVVVVKYK